MYIKYIPMYKYVHIHTHMHMYKYVHIHIHVYVCTYSIIFIVSHCLNFTFLLSYSPCSPISPHSSHSFSFTLLPPPFYHSLLSTFLLPSPIFFPLLSLLLFHPSCLHSLFLHPSPHPYPSSPEGCLLPRKVSWCTLTRSFSTVFQECTEMCRDSCTVCVCVCVCVCACVCVCGVTLVVKEVT